jgi:hypothetical protein
MERDVGAETSKYADASLVSCGSFRRFQPGMVDRKHQGGTAMKLLFSIRYRRSWVPRHGAKGRQMA